MSIVMGGFLFWALVFGTLILCELSTAADNHWSVAWILLFLGMLTFFGEANPFVYMWQHAVAMLLYFGIYIAIGVCWGFAKWYFYLKNELDKINKNLTLFKGRYADAIARISSPFKGTFTDWLQENNYISIASQNKYKLSIWMCWWPFSMFWSLFDDVLRRFWSWVVDRFMGIYSKINNAVFGHLNT